jgi:uncharacterized coiled-coil protein SlyX
MAQWRPGDLLVPRGRLLGVRRTRCREWKPLQVSGTFLRYRAAMSAKNADRDEPRVDAERVMDLEVRLAYQDRQVRELDALVREFGERLDKAERELAQLKQALVSPEAGIGPGNEPPPHY